MTEPMGTMDISETGATVRFERTPTSMRHHPPGLGEQSDEILAAAGFDSDEITALRERGVLG